MNRISEERLYEYVNDKRICNISDEVMLALTELLERRQAEKEQKPVAVVVGSSMNHLLCEQKTDGALLPTDTLLYLNQSSPAQDVSFLRLRAIAERVINNLYASGYEPVQNSIHPWESLLFDAEHAINSCSVLAQQQTISDKALLAWADRHDIEKSLSDIKCAYEDAISLHLLEASNDTK